MDSREIRFYNFQVLEVGVFHADVGEARLSAEHQPKRENQEQNHSIAENGGRDFHGLVGPVKEEYAAEYEVEQREQLEDPELTLYRVVDCAAS